MTDDMAADAGREGPDRNLVCVVDDDPTQLGEITDYLRHKGFRVMGAADGALAVAEIERHKPALVLMDIKMPGCDGIRAAQFVQILSPETMIVLMSGDPDEVVRAHRSDRISLRVLHKPVPLRQFARFAAGVLGETGV